MWLFGCWLGFGGVEALAQIPRCGGCNGCLALAPSSIEFDTLTGVEVVLVQPVAEFRSDRACFASAFGGVEVESLPAGALSDVEPLDAQRRVKEVEMASRAGVGQVPAGTRAGGPPAPHALQSHAPGTTDALRKLVPRPWPPSAGPHLSLPPASPKREFCRQQQPRSSGAKLHIAPRTSTHNSRPAASPFPHAPRIRIPSKRRSTRAQPPRFIATSASSTHRGTRRQPDDPHDAASTARALLRAGPAGTVRFIAAPSAIASSGVGVNSGAARQA